MKGGLRRKRTTGDAGRARGTGSRPGVGPSAWPGRLRARLGASPVDPRAWPGQSTGLARKQAAFRRFRPPEAFGGPKGRQEKPRGEKPVPGAAVETSGGPAQRTKPAAPEAGECRAPACSRRPPGSREARGSVRDRWTDRALPRRAIPDRPRRPTFLHPRRPRPRPPHSGSPGSAPSVGAPGASSSSVLPLCFPPSCLPPPPLPEGVLLGQSQRAEGL